MRLLVIASALTLGLIACNQIAGIKKPDGTSTGGSTTGSGDDATSADDSTATDDTTSGDDTTGTTKACTEYSSGCGNGTTCRYQGSTATWACTAVGQSAVGASCSAATDCDYGADCFVFQDQSTACVEYCSPPSSSCTTLGLAGTCTATINGATWGICYPETGAATGSN